MLSIFVVPQCHAAFVHPPCKIDRLGPADHHLLGIAAAEDTGPAERTMIDHRDRASRAADTSRRRLRGGARADHDEVKEVHGLPWARRRAR
jgi:hypothetical protein